MLKLINHSPIPTKEALDLKKALEERGVRVYKELNEMIRKHLKEISEALAEASKIRERKICVHLN